jgi:hypothetical protein
LPERFSPRPGVPVSVNPISLPFLRKSSCDD